MRFFCVSKPSMAAVIISCVSFGGISAFSLHGSAFPNRGWMLLGHAVEVAAQLRDIHERRSGPRSRDQCHQQAHKPRTWCDAAQPDARRTIPGHSIAQTSRPPVFGLRNSGAARDRAARRYAVGVPEAIRICSCRERCGLGNRAIQQCCCGCGECPAGWSLRTAKPSA